MIIYKIEDSGQCRNLQFSKTCPEGYESMEGDRLPDIKTLHTAAYKTERATTQYLRDRVYDPIPQQMNDLFDAVKAGIPLKESSWYTKQEAEKLKHPKPIGG